MKDYGTVESTVKPDEVTLDEYHVYTASDITETKRTEEATGEETVIYQYHLIEYSKDEYVKKTATQTTSLQEAVANLYETISTTSTTKSEG